MRLTREELAQREAERDEELLRLKDEARGILGGLNDHSFAQPLIDLIEKAYGAGEIRGEEDGWNNAPDGW